MILAATDPCAPDPDDASGSNSVSCAMLAQPNDYINHEDFPRRDPVNVERWASPATATWRRFINTRRMSPP